LIGRFFPRLNRAVDFHRADSDHRIVCGWAVNWWSGILLLWVIVTSSGYDCNVFIDRSFHFLNSWISINGTTPRITC